MGMFDDVHIIARPDIACVNGHPLVDAQTKDLDCNMDGYYVDNDELLKRMRGSQSDESIVRSDSGACLVSKSRLERSDYSGPVSVYSSCQLCPPVYVRKSERDWQGSYLSANQPWVEWTLLVERGRIVGVEPSSGTQTREALREQLRRGGNAVLADDDPLVLAEATIKAASRQ